MDTLNRLDSFISKDKFSNEEWNRRGLNPSSSSISNKLNLVLNDSAKELIILLKDNSVKSDLKKALKKNLKSLNKKEFDTEEKEFIADTFIELSEIVNVDFKNELNSWIYGAIGNAFIKAAEVIREQENIVDIITQDCTNCKSKLESFVLEREEGIPDYSYTVVKCNVCGNFNLLDNGPGIKRLKFGNYIWIQELRKEEYTVEQAKNKLEQMK